MKTLFINFLRFIAFLVLPSYVVAREIEWNENDILSSGWRLDKRVNSEDTLVFPETEVTNHRFAGGWFNHSMSPGTFSFTSPASHTFDVTEGFNLYFYGKGIDNKSTGTQKFNIFDDRATTSITFKNASSMGNSIYNCNGLRACVVLDTTEKANQATVNLKNSSQLYIYQTNEVGRVNTDETSTIYFWGTSGNVLTLGASGGVQTIAGPVKDFWQWTNDNALVKTGPGIVVLSNLENNYTGGTRIDDGVLSISNNANLGYSPKGVTFNGDKATLQITKNVISDRPLNLNSNGAVDVVDNTVRWNGQISGNGGLIAQGENGTLILNGHNTYAGGTTVNKLHTLSISDDKNLGEQNAPITLNKGTLLITDELASARPIYLNEGIINTQSGNTTFSGTITGDGLVKHGKGQLTLTGEGSNYNGINTVVEGVLALGYDVSSLPSNTRIILSKDGTVAFKQNGSGTYVGNISGDGNLTVDIGQKKSLTLTGLNGSDFKGNVQISNGRLILDNQKNMTLSGPIVNNESLVISQPESTVGVVEGQISGKGSFDSKGKGLVILNQARYDGPTTINEGTLQFNNDVSNTLAGPISVKEKNAKVNFEQAADTFGTYGAVFGNGGVIVNAGKKHEGAVVLANGATYSGPTTVHKGTYYIKNQMSNDMPSQFEVLKKGIVVFDQASDTKGIYRGLISGEGGLGINLDSEAKGVVALVGGATYSGPTIVKNGTLKFFNDSKTPNVLPSPISLGKDTVLNLEQSADTLSVYAGPISGSGSVVVNAENGHKGHVLFTGGTSYTGPTAVKAGFLGISNKTDNTFVSNVSVSKEAIVNFEQASETCHVNGAITGKGSVIVNGLGGNGRVVFNNIHNSYTGTTEIVGGIVQVSTATLPSVGGVVLGSEGILAFEQRGITTGTYKGSISGDGNVSVNSQPGHSGRLILTGEKNYKGSTIVNDGVLELVNKNSMSLPGAVVLNKGAILDVKQMANTEGSFIGNISGDGKLIVNNCNDSSGIVALSGKNSYTGGTEVMRGMLVGDSDSIQGNIVNNSAIQFNQKTSDTFKGQISGNGIMTIAGTGKLNIETPCENFTGNTFVHGTFAMNNHLGGNVFVLPNAVIMGTGTLKGDLVVEGALIPGNSIGTMTISGNYVQKAGSTYVVQIMPGNKNSATHVAGTATLEDNTKLMLVPLNKETLDVGRRYTIIHAENGLTGKFAEVNPVNPLLLTKLSYDAKNAYVTFDVAFEAVNTPTEQKVIDQLTNIINPTPAQSKILLELALLEPDDFQHALDQMSGQQFASTLLTAEFVNRRFIRTLYDPLRSLIVRNPCTYCYYENCCYEDTYGSFEPWITISSSHASVEGKRNVKGYKLTDNELTFGAQATFNDYWTLGTAASFGWDEVHYHLGGRSKNRVALGGIYGLYRPEYFYLMGDIVYGRSINRVKRRIDIGNAEFRPRSNLKVDQGTAYIEAGKEFCCCIALFQPFVGFEYGYYRFNNFHEHCGVPLDLTIQKKSQCMAYSRLGMHLTTMPIPCGFSMALDIAWQYRLTQFNDKIRVRFFEFGDTFSVRGFELDRNSIDGAVSFRQDLACGWEIFAELAGQYWRHANSYSVLGGVKVEW